MSQVLQTAEARLDLLEIWSYIARDSPRSADRLLDEIDKKCQLFAEFPGMGHQRDDLAPALRSFSVEDYLVFYRSVEAGIEVIRVLHGSRDIVHIFHP